MGVRQVRIADTIAFPNGATGAVIVLMEVESLQGSVERYALPVAFATGREAGRVRETLSQAVVAELRRGGRGRRGDGVLYDALESSAWSTSLLDAIGRRRQVRGGAGEVGVTITRAYRSLRGPADVPLPVSILRAEQSHTSLVFGERLILKLYRRLAEGINPDLQVGRCLTEQARFTHTAPVAGALEYRKPRREPLTLGFLQGFVPNERDLDWRRPAGDGHLAARVGDGDQCGDARAGAQHRAG
jgi:trehalose synthase-fused probable maltokinase